jgi:hypothetical protein
VCVNLPDMTVRMLSLAITLSLVSAGALAGVKRDCARGCAARVVVECDGLGTRKARKRCTKAQLSACRRAARRVPKAERGSAIAAFCQSPVTTTTLGLPTSPTTTAPASTTTTTTLPSIPNVRGTWFFDGTLVSDTCGLNELFFTTGIRVTSQAGTTLAGNLGSGIIPWDGVVLDDGWGGVTQVRCEGSCCNQSLFAVAGFGTFADALFDLDFECVGIGPCRIRYVGSIAKQ